MTYSFSCPNGHAWESDAANAQCPVCGSMVESRDEGESSTWDSGIDELPPPPARVLDRSCRNRAMRRRNYPVTRSPANWAGAEWGSFTRRGIARSSGAWPSR